MQAHLHHNAGWYALTNGKGVASVAPTPFENSGRATPNSQAFTLLEVILALAILAGALASLGEVVRLSGEHANYARDHSQAQLLAASKLAEITAGAEELTNVAPTRFKIDSDPPWLYSIQSRSR